MSLFGGEDGRTLFEQAKLLGSRDGRLGLWTSFTKSVTGVFDLYV
jgi:hypothetical protein